MGLAKGAIKVLLEEGTQRPFTGRVLTLGRQDIWVSYDMLQEFALNFRYELSPCEVTLSKKPEFASNGYISDECLFKSIGFSDLKSLDFSEYEAADYIYDLNSSKAPEHLTESFDVIVDGGTIEHVFNIPNALNNIFQMLRPGGRTIHLSPSSNYIDHGFYMFSPTLFWDYYTVNNFRINKFHLAKHTPRAHIDPWEIMDYLPGCLGHVSFGGLDDAMYGIICIATKTEVSTGIKFPQQGSYTKVWEGKTDVVIQDPVIPVHSAYSSCIQKLKGTIKSVPLLYWIVRKFLSMLHPKQKGPGLKIIARY